MHAYHLSIRKTALCFCLLGAILALPTEAGRLSYPLLGNMDVEEGTIEFWFVPMTDLYPAEKRAYVSVLSLFSVDGADDFTAGGGWYRSGAQLGMKVSIGSRDKSVRNALLPVLPGTWTPTDWKPGELHHLAFVWTGTHMRTFADGKLHGVRGQSQPFSGHLGGAWLRFGDPWTDRRSRFILHAVRVSSVARRYDGEGVPAVPQADVATLILDIFDRPPEGVAEQTTARLVSGLSGETGGRLIGKYHWVRGPIPGLALYPAPKPKAAAATAADPEDDPDPDPEADADPDAEPTDVDAVAEPAATAPEPTPED